MHCIILKNDNINICFRRVHISSATLACLQGAYEVEPGHGNSRDNYLKVNQM